MTTENPIPILYQINLIRSFLIAVSIARRTQRPRATNPVNLVLVIEDQALNRKVVRIVLQSKGYQVIEAINADEALTCLEKTIPALILMDIALPGQSGEELTRQIKVNPDWCEIPIIALTAAAMSGDRERLPKAGCDDYLSKPIDTQVLLERVAHHLKGSAS